MIKSVAVCVVLLVLLLLGCRIGSHDDAVAVRETDRSELLPADDNSNNAYHVIVDGAGLGDNVHRFPMTGGETVSDAIAHFDGIDDPSKFCIWIARPASGDMSEILPVDWSEIEQKDDAPLDHRLKPGDRIYITERVHVSWDEPVVRKESRFERIFGFSIIPGDRPTRFSGKVLEGTSPDRFSDEFHQSRTVISPE